MKEIRNLIDQLVHWGEDYFPNFEENEKNLTHQLVQLYQIYLSTEAEFTDQSFPDPPEIISDINLKEQIQKNFPSWGYYNQILNPVDHIGRPEFGMGDATEDLLEFIKGLKGLQWRFKHYCQTDSLWHFRFLYDHQLALLSVNLLRYMEVKKLHQRVLE